MCIVVGLAVRIVVVVLCIVVGLAVCIVAVVLCVLLYCVCIAVFFYFRCRTAG